MTAGERDILMLRYLDGAATTDEVQTLNELLAADASARAAMAEIAMQAVAMGDLARERGAGKPGARFGSPAAPRWWRRIGVALAASILIVSGLLAWLGRSESQTLLLAQASGAVSWSNESGQRRSGLAGGAELTAGTLSVEGAASSAQLRFADGSTLILAGDTELTFADGGQKRLALRRGSLLADVRPQPAGRPMLVRTDTAEAQVLGTRFSLSARTGETALAVETGCVRLVRLADGQGMEVPSGHAAVATLDVAEKLQSHPLPPAPAQWCQTFDRPPSAAWQGEWRPPGLDAPGRLFNVIDVSERRADGTVIVAYVVNIRDNSGSIASIRPDSVLRLRWRSQPRHDVLALVALHRPTGGFAGVFQTLIRPDAAPADVLGWREIELPVASMEAKTPGFLSPPVGGRVFLVYVACYSPDTKLELAEAAIESPSAMRRSDE